MRRVGAAGGAAREEGSGTMQGKLRRRRVGAAGGATRERRHAGGVEAAHAARPIGAVWLRAPMSCVPMCVTLLGTDIVMISTAGGL